jgi:hypothetical protein
MALPDLGRWLFPRWLLAFIAFPPAGLLGHAVAGPADTPLAGLLSGVIAGAIIGLGQGLALGARSRDLVAWSIATAIGLGLALAIEVAVSGPLTTTMSVVILGAFSGLVIGIEQGGLLSKEDSTTRSIWAATMAVSWAIGWFVTATVGVDLANGWPIFGASGAITAQAISGIALVALVERRRRAAAVTA